MGKNDHFRKEVKRLLRWKDEEEYGEDEWAGF